MKMFSIFVIFFTISAVDIQNAYAQTDTGNINSNKAITNTLSTLKNQFEEAKINVKINIFDNIEKNMILKADSPEIILTGNNKYRLCFTVNWSIDPNKIRSTLSKYFNISEGNKYHRNYYLNINMDSNHKTNFSEPLLSYLSNNRMTVLIYFGKTYALINLTDSPNWCFYYKGNNKYCVDDLSENQLSDYQNISTQLILNATISEGNGPIIKWQDIYGRDDIGQRYKGGFSLGYDSNGAGTEYIVKGRYSEIHGEYHGAWASFEEYKIDWEFNRINQFSTKNGDKKGWYIKNKNNWIKE